MLGRLCFNPNGPHEFPRCESMHPKSHVTNNKGKPRCFKGAFQIALCFPGFDHTEAIVEG